MSDLAELTGFGIRNQWGEGMRGLNRARPPLDQRQALCAGECPGRVKYTFTPEPSAVSEDRDYSMGFLCLGSALTVWIGSFD